MRQRLRSHWFTVEDLEMTGLIKHKEWEHMLKTYSLNFYDEFSDEFSLQDQMERW
jgi:hypothetical protein